MERNDLSLILGRRIKAIRMQMGLSQDEFAGLVGADRTYVCKIENGRRNLTIKKLCSICEKCGFTLQDFFNDSSFSQYFS